MLHAHHAVVLKVVYHETSEGEDSEEGYYITIESALIPDRYLAINMDHPTKQENDTFYPVQFMSKEKVYMHIYHTSIAIIKLLFCIGEMVQRP